MEWQPIETAPKDGSVILTGSYLEEYSGEYEPIKTGRMEWAQEFARFDGGWRSTGWYSGLLSPTHWMPLPEPPK